MANALRAVPAPTSITPELVVTAHEDIAAIPEAAPVKVRLKPIEPNAQDKGYRSIAIVISR